MAALASVIFVAGQFAPFLALFLSDDAFALAYLTSHDASILGLAMFAYAVAPWKFTRFKMVAFFFVWWSGACLIGNATVEVSGVSDPVVLAWGWVLVFAGAGLACLRFLVKAPLLSDTVYKGHLYALVSPPQNVWGAFGLVLTGKGGHFAVWDPENETVYRYNAITSEVDRFRLESVPPSKLALDMGPATAERREKLAGLIGSRWTIFRNCLTTLGRV